MKKEIIFLMILVLASPFMISADDTNQQDIIIDSQIKDTYNLGDRVPLSIKITSTVDISSNLILKLICEGHETDLMNMNYFTISSAERESIEYPLSLDNMKELTGTCKLKASFGDDYTIKEFKLTDKLNASIEEVSDNIKPGKHIIVKGDVLKQNPSTEGFDGFYTFNLIFGEKKEKKEGLVENGFFKINTTIPEKIAAGRYTGKLEVYEKNSKGEKSNTGEAGFEFSVAQIPTNLEIVVNEEEIEPGNEAEIKAILHDQTGKNIPRNVTVTVKNPLGKMVRNENLQTGESLSFELEKDTPPGEWNITAVSKNMKSQGGFKTIKNKEVDVNLVNNTVFIKNTGNVPYNGSVDVKIGNKTVKVPTSLELGGEKKYYLSAPEGNYTVEVLADGEKRIQENVQLTGRSISIDETLDGNLIRNPIVWGFVIIVLGVILYIIFRKGYKRSFIGRKIHSNRKDKKKSSKEKNPKKDSKEKERKEAQETEEQKEGILPKYHNKAELSLSIKGNKQDANLICLKIKNYDEVKQNPEGVKETLHKIVKKAEHEKAYIYEANDNMFFIFAPEITKTFKNERNAIKTAREIEADIRKHNKYFKQRIDFGISVNRGEIVARKEKKDLKFMSVGKLTTSAKKLASISKGETLLTKEINEKLSAEIKTEKGEYSEKSGESKMQFYRVKEVKDRSQNQKFLNEFVKRYKEDGQKKE